MSKPVVEAVETEDNSSLEGNPRYKQILEANAQPDDAPEGEAGKPGGDGEAGDEGTSTQDDDAPEGEASADEGDENGEGGEDPAGEGDEFDKYPKGFAKQLKRKERQIGRMSRQMEAMQAHMQQLMQYQQQQPQMQHSKPTKEQFASEEEYLDWAVSERLREMTAESSKEHQQVQAQRQQYTELANSWNEKIRANFPDAASQAAYAEALEDLGHPGEVLDKRVNDYIFRSPVGPKMLAYLSQHPEAIPQINSMHDWDLATSLQRLASHLSAKQPQAAQQQPGKPKPVSKAPAPQGKLGAGKKGSVQDGSTMTQSEVMAYYRKNGRMPDGVEE